MILIITLLPGIFIILGAIVFEMRNMGKINRQLLLGVTLPTEAFQLKEVKGIQKAYLLCVKKFTFVGIITGLLFIALFKQKVSIQILYFMVWTTMMCIAPMVIHVPYYKRLKALKIQEGWLIGNKHEILIDTKLARMKEKLGISQKWFYVLLIFPVLNIMISLLGKGDASLDILFPGIQLSVILIIMGSNYLCRKLRIRVYSTNTEINRTINDWQKRNIAYGLLLGGVSSGILISITQLYTLQMIIYNSIILSCCITIITVFQIGIIIFMYQRTRYYIEGITLIDEDKCIIDEDDYWINGQIYYNPNDPKMFVNKRIGIGSSMNMGNPKAKVLTVIISVFIAVLMIYSVGIVFVLDFSIPQVRITTNKEVWIDYPTYNEHFKISEVKEVKLLEELPPTSKINGVSTDEYARGYFTMKGYGQVKGYWYTEISPYIVITLGKKIIVIGEETKEKTLALYEELIQAKSKF